MKLLIILMMIQATAFSAIGLDLGDKVIAVKAPGSLNACASKLARKALDYASNDFDQLKITNVKTTTTKTTFKMVDRFGEVIYVGAMKLLHEDRKCYLSKYLSLKNVETKTAEFLWKEKVMQASLIVDPLDPLKKYSF